MAFNYYKIFTWRQSLQTKRLVTAGRLYASFLLVLLYSCLLVWAAPIPATNSTEVPEELHARNPMRHPGKVHWRRSIPVADIVIGLSYCAIPIELAFFVLRLPSTTVQQRCVGGLFVAFILACGLGHFIDASVGESGPEIVVYIIRYDPCRICCFRGTAKSNLFVDTLLRLYRL
ncbi:hypothetical protein BC832DRAFT_105955 [Gaertneriomyces semiglobifer]|nr:hypothetical protein BC832DRAFT_105955 [Gaertneriomyces semiglobifer]